ncbi:unnamed protein product [Cochlearia groenlandica]
MSLLQTNRSFSSIEGDFCREPVVARLIHSWEAQNFCRGNALMGLELLLIDLKKAKEKERYCCGGGGGAYYEGGYSGVF